MKRKLGSLVSSDSYSPMVTVVVRAYNEEALIANVLSALQKQTYKNFEILVVDNNSTDNTVAIAKKYGVRIIPETQQGHGYALNRGLQEAKGDIIAITDADTQPDRDWLEYIVHSMQSQNVVGLTGFTKFDIKSKPLYFFTNNAFMLFTYLNFLLGKPHISGFNMAVKRDAIEYIGNLDPKYQIGEDVNLGLLLKGLGKIIYARNAVVSTSTRRWEREATKTFLKYSAVYIYTVWLRKPFPEQLSTIR